MEADSVSMTAIVGIIGAILTVFIKLFDVINSWKKSRKDDIRVKKEIDDTLKEVEFINGWLTAVNNSTNDKERNARRNIALNRLDNLMSHYQSYCSVEKIEPTIADATKGNKGFYAMSVFLGLVILGLFVDDEDNWSMTYFQNNLDSDTLLVFGIFFVIWIYFLFNSRFYSKIRNS
ncbi:MAG: hypothetical protein JKX75_04800 [Gammaproteobacteria bacterium]|nr:hypothetical protein [Gammaproteobacteria bacterium]